MKTTALGNIIGSRPYLGRCANNCGAQFMSTHDQAALVPNRGIICGRCAADPSEEVTEKYLLPWKGVR